MLCTLDIAVDCDAKTMVESIFGGVAIGRHNGTIAVKDFGAEQEDVCAGISGEGIEMIQDGFPDRVGVCIHDEVDIDINCGAALLRWISRGGRTDRPGREKISTGKKSTYKSNRGLLVDLGLHLVYDVGITRDADIGDQVLGLAVQGFHLFGFGRGDGGFDPPVAGIAYLTA